MRVCPFLSLTHSFSQRSLDLLSPIASRGRRDSFSTHVKLQLLPKFIPMASCCAEEMLIAKSPPILDYVHFATRASARLPWGLWCGRRIGWEADRS